VRWKKLNECKKAPCRRKGGEVARKVIRQFAEAGIYYGYLIHISIGHSEDGEPAAGDELEVIDLRHSVRQGNPGGLGGASLDDQAQERISFREMGRDFLRFANNVGDCLRIKSNVVILELVANGAGSGDCAAEGE
jgi:hypothetical protein